MTLIPHGADAVVKLVDAHDSGKLTGKSEVTLALWSVKVDGKVVDVNTQTISKQSDTGKGTKTGTMAGGGAVAGAIIGAIAGGGKGAAVGAGAGAAAGTGVSAVTKGPAVKVPSGNRADVLARECGHNLAASHCALPASTPVRSSFPAPRAEPV